MTRTDTEPVRRLGEFLSTPFHKSGNLFVRARAQAAKRPVLVIVQGLECVSSDYDYEHEHDTLANLEIVYFRRSGDSV